MNFNHLITANQNNFQTIGVCLNTQGSSRMYTYKAPIDMVLSPGDTVLISKNGTPKEGMPEYRAALVGEVHETPQIDYTSGINYTWIVDKVDDVQYREQLELEQNQAQQLARMEVSAKKREFMKQIEENSPEMLDFFDSPVILQPQGSTKE